MPRVIFFSVSAEDFRTRKGCYRGLPSHHRMSSGPKPCKTIKCSLSALRVVEWESFGVQGAMQSIIVVEAVSVRIILFIDLIVSW